MVKAPVKKKQKKVIKQKQKQKVKVTQNVKVIVGDVKRKRAVKSSSSKQGASAKPPIVLNISQPQQPYNNMFMEFFKNQLQNQQPVKANTLAEQEKINEREENKASKAGALAKIDQEPDDVARELRRQKVEMLEKIAKTKAGRKNEIEDMRKSLKPVSARKMPATPLRPRQPTPREVLMRSIRENVAETPPAVDSDMLNELRAQQSTLRSAINQAGGAGEEEGGAEETKTEVGDWDPRDEQPLGENDYLYRKPATYISDELSKKTLADLRKMAQVNKIPYNRNGKALSKAELTSNLLRHFTTGSPQARPGRPRKK